GGQRRSNRVISGLLRAMTKNPCKSTQNHPPGVGETVRIVLNGNRRGLHSWGPITILPQRSVSYKALETKAHRLSYATMSGGSVGSSCSTVLWRGQAGRSSG